MIISVWVLSGIISIPPLFGWKEDVDLDWFFDILSERGNRTQMEFLQDLQQSGQIDIQNFTKTLESIVYPQCSVSSKNQSTYISLVIQVMYIPDCNHLIDHPKSFK